MKKLKTLIVTVTGRIYFAALSLPKTETYTYQVTGSNLSIRKAESDAVNKFLTTNKIGRCGLTSKLEA